MTLKKIYFFSYDKKEIWSNLIGIEQRQEFTAYEWQKVNCYFNFNLLNKCFLHWEECMSHKNRLLFIISFVIWISLCLQKPYITIKDKNHLGTVKYLQKLGLTCVIYSNEYFCLCLQEHPDISGCLEPATYQLLTKSL